MNTGGRLIAVVMLVMFLCIGGIVAVSIVGGGVWAWQSGALAAMVGDKPHTSVDDTDTAVVTDPSSEAMRLPSAGPVEAALVAVQPVTVTITVTDTAASEALSAQIVADAAVQAEEILSEAAAEAEAVRAGAAALLEDCEKSSQPTAWASDPDYGQEWQIGSPEETCWILVEWRFDGCAVDPVEDPVEASEECWGVFVLPPGHFAIMPFDTAGTVYVLGPDWNPENHHERAQENIAVGMYARWVANGGNAGVTVPTNDVPEGTEVKYVDENGVTQLVDPAEDWPESIHYQDVRFLELPADEVEEEAYP